jgi:cation transport regulator ChaC
MMSLSSVFPFSLEVWMPSAYVFGYGSLISSSSLKITLPDAGPGSAVTVRGLSRGWWVPDFKRGLMGLGAVTRKGAATNGVIFEVSAEQLEVLDGRERPHGYTTVPVPASDISGVEIAPDAVTWAYVFAKPQMPSEMAPIAQSYVDVVISGCLEFGTDFAESFVRSTLDWDYPWINDRFKHPRYSRHESGLPHDVIDAILERLVPEAFAKRYEEPTD